MRKISASFLLSVVIVLGLAGPLKAEVIIVNASTAGFLINDGGRNVSGAGVGNYFSGNCGLNDCRIGEHRNFFEFKIPQFFGTVSSARLTLDTYGVTALQAPSLTYRVTSIPPTFRFSDLGNGLVYGSRNYSVLDADEPRTIVLSSAALAAIQPLTTFRIGGRVTSPTRYGPDEPSQGVFAGSGGFGGSGPGGFPLVQLEIVTGTSPPPLPDRQDIYGIFVGVYDGQDNTLRFERSTELIDGTYRGYHAEEIAEDLQKAFSANIRGVKETILMKGSAVTGGINPSEVYENIRHFSQKMDGNDKLVIYIGGHGGRAPVGLSSERYDEASPLSPEDEGIQLYGGVLWDDELSSVLLDATASKDFETWLFIDSCYSGGFWGNYGGNDSGDLEQLRKVALLASAQESGFGRFKTLDGRTFFGDALIEAFSLSAPLFGSSGITSSLRGDLDKNGSLTFEEIRSFVDTFWNNEFSRLSAVSPLPVVGFTNQPEIETLQGLAEVLSFNSFSPVAYKSDDFSGNFFGNVLPAPSSLALFGFAVVLLAYQRRRKIRLDVFV